MSKIKSIDINQFAEILKKSDERYFFVLGTGASKTSGIKTGKEYAKIWFEDCKNIYPEKTVLTWQKKLAVREIVKKNLRENYKFFRDNKEKSMTEKRVKSNVCANDIAMWINENFSERNIGNLYAEIFRFRYKNAGEGYKFLQSDIQNAEASYGYYFLAWMLSRTDNDLAIVISFDDLMEYTLNVFSKTRPIAVGLEELEKYFDITDARAKLIYLHKDVAYNPRNRISQVSTKKDSKWISMLNLIFNLYTPIFIGYGGNDGSLMKFMQELAPYKKNSYWWHVEKSVDELPENIRALMEKHGGTLVNIDGFDEAAYILKDVEFKRGQNRLKFENPYKKIDDISEERQKKFKAQISDIKKRLNGLDKLTSTQKQTLELVEKDLEGTLEFYNNKLKIDPNHVKTYRNRSNLYIDFGDYEKALADDNMVVKLRPENSHSYNNRGITYLKLKKYDKAILDFTKALDIDPDNEIAYNNRGVAYLELKEYDKAVLDFNKCLTLEPCYTDSYKNRASAFCSMKNFDKALVDLNRAIDLNNKYYNAYKARAELYFNIKNYEQALKDCIKALEVASKNTDKTEILEIKEKIEKILQKN